MITISIDVTKIDKSRIKDGNNGQKYLDLSLIETPNNQYGDDFMIVHKSSKAERDEGYKSPILGNGKDWSKEDGASRPAPAPQPTQDAPEEDIPF